MRERRKLKHVVLTMEVTPFLKVYSTVFEHRHSHILADDCIQIYIQENTALLL